VYAYRFDWDEGGSFLWTDLSKMLGASHGMEIPFVFNRFQLTGSADAVLFEDDTLATRTQLSRAMGAYWAEFARSGNPNLDGSTAWPPYGGTANLMRFDSATDGGIHPFEDRETLGELITDINKDQRLNEAGRCELAASFTGLSDQQRTQLVKAVGCETGSQDTAR
jgi:para-nitrobenzyl esterase